MVLDAFSRKVLGWAMRERMKANLVLAARHTQRAESVINHSNQASQYTSIAFGIRCQEIGVRISMKTVRDACDNAMLDKLFCQLAVSADQPAFLEELGGGPQDPVYLDRELAQPTPAPLGAGTP